MPCLRPTAIQPDLPTSRRHPRRFLATTLLGGFLSVPLLDTLVGLTAPPFPHEIQSTGIIPLEFPQREPPTLAIGFRSGNLTESDERGLTPPEFAVPEAGTPFAPSISDGEPPASKPNTSDDPSGSPINVNRTATAESYPRSITHKIRSGETLFGIFSDTDLDTTSLDRILNDRATAGYLSSIRAGQELRILLGDDAQLQSLEYDIDELRILKVHAAGEGFTATIEETPVQQRIRIASGFVENSLFESGQQAGLSNKVIMQMAELFRWDIDFALEIRSGDQYTVIYEQRWLDGRKLDDGPILAAEFVNQGRSYRAVRYANPDGNVAYYTPEGKPLRKTFLRTPVDFTRVSSGFSKNRWHPVLKERRAHNGVDYAAPEGTPVHAAGNGKVMFKGRQGGYGNLVILQHGEHYSTVYGHLSRFARNLKVEDQVQQGQVIGYVGQTGLATGPHLHYELRVDGVHRNPLNLKVSMAAPLPNERMADFRRTAKPLLVQLDLLNRTLVAQAR